MARDAYDDLTPERRLFPFYLRQVLSGPHENFHYVLGDFGTREAALVDPAFHVGRLVGEAQKAGWRVRGAFFTHGHWDHIGGVPEVFSLGVEWMAVHEAARDHPKLREAKEAGAEVRLLRDGDVQEVGSEPVQALHTPGHQPEATCFLAGESDSYQALFGGDCLFIGSCGRTDFPGGDTEAMFESLARLRALQGDVIVLPGHHYGRHTYRSLQDEVRENPALATTDRARFETLPCLRG